jgi:hypothetical protein
MVDTPRIKLTEISSTQAQKEVVVNENMYELDAWIPKTALSISTSANTAPGAVYIVASAATGPFLGESGKLAFAIGNDWQFREAIEGIVYYVVGEETFYSYVGTEWKPLNSFDMSNGTNHLKYTSVVAVSGGGVAIKSVGDGLIFLTDLPISDPGVEDAVFVSAGYLKISS